MQGSLLPLYIIERGFSNKVAGLTSTAYMLASVLLRPVSGRMTDKSGRYGVAIFGAVIYCVATGLYFFAVPVTLLIVMRIVQGVGFSFDSTGAYVLATDNIPESRMAEGLGYLGCSQTVAIALAPMIAISLKNSFGYKTAFMTIFTLSALVPIIILLLRFIITRTFKPAAVVRRARLHTTVFPAKREPILSMIVDKNALKPALLMLLVMFAGMTTSIFLAPYATISGIANPGLFFTVQAVMAFAARLTMGKIQQRVGASTVLILGMLLIFCGLFGLVLRVSLPILVICGVLYGLGIGVVQPQLSALAMLAAGKDNRGKATSTFFMMMDGGSAACGFIFGAIADTAGYVSIFAIAAAIALGTLFLYIVMQKKIGVSHNAKAL